MDHMRDLVQKFVQKGLLEFAYVHNLLWEYTQEALTDSNTHRMSDLVNQLASDKGADTAFELHGYFDQLPRAIIRTDVMKLLGPALTEWSMGAHYRTTHERW